MEITSIYFLTGSVGSIFIYYFLGPKLKIPFLAVLSCGFVFNLSPILLVYVIAYSLANYLLGFLIAGSKYKILIFRIGLIINLAQIVILKYADFTLDPIFNLFNIDLNFSYFPKLIVPIGISYFTLQGIGYLFNVKMGWEKPERNFLNFFLYIIFFPKFLSGPIERSNHFLPQIRTGKKFNRQQVTDGLRLLIMGVFSKEVIANQLGLIVNQAYVDIEPATGVALWIVLVIQPLYLYFDFSGYTNIALGIAKCYGLDLLPNFDRPFFAENVTTFWKKFHMSLAFWFNDYVFKQMSFRLRKLKTHATTLAVFVTWMLFGIWHGAGWNFMLLGVLQSLAIYYEFFSKKARVRFFSKLPDLLGLWLGRISTYLFYGISLVFFFSPDMDSVYRFFINLWQFETTRSLKIEDKMTFILSFGFLIFFMVLEYGKNDKPDSYKWIEKVWSSTKSEYRLLRLGLYCGIILSILYFGGQETEFIYFQF